MKIGVIGIGEIGGTISRIWSEKGHSVRVANSRGPEAVKQFAHEIGADAADIYGAVERADVVLLSIPFPTVAKLPKDLFNRVAEGAVIIDTGNYYPDVRDPHVPEIDAGMPRRATLTSPPRPKLSERLSASRFSTKRTARQARYSLRCATAQIPARVSRRNVRSAC